MSLRSSSGGLRNPECALVTPQPKVGPGESTFAASLLGACKLPDSPSAVQAIVLIHLDPWLHSQVRGGAQLPAAGAADVPAPGQARAARQGVAALL